MSPAMVNDGVEVSRQMTASEGHSEPRSSLTAVRDGSPSHSNASIEPARRPWARAVREEVVGWRAWVTGMGSLCLTVLILNSVLTGLAFNRQYNYPSDAGLATFYDGPCSTTKTAYLLIKLGINILAACLLGASNYCMQVLISPLREEVDKAHDRKIWLFIGIPNIKNLFFIDYKRRIVWLLFFVTSVPLHLLWNSAVVSTVVSNDYYVTAVSQDFTKDAPASITSYNSQPWFVGSDQGLYSWLDRARSGNTTTLSAADCLAAYTTNLVDQYSNLVMIMNTANSTNALLFAGTYISQIQSKAGVQVLWPCGVPAPTTSPCGFGALRANNGSNWTPLVTLAGSSYERNDNYLASLAEVTVNHCIAEDPEAQCRLGAHPQILVTVLVCNAVKLIAIIVTWWYADMKDDKCITSGELIRSYIRRPDPRFYNRCLAGITAIKKQPEQFWDARTAWPMTWHKQKIRSWQSVPLLIWVFYIIPALCGTIVLLGVFFGYNLQDTLYVGFGTPSLSSTLPWRSNIRVIQATLVANLPQLVTSYIYVGCNAVLTGIWCQEELMHYSKAVLNVMSRDDASEKDTKLSKRQSRKKEETGPQALRVTQPQGVQRETFYLTLPWGSSIPLLLSSIALHWFVSESLFLLRVSVVETDGIQAEANVITTVGYSSGPILAVILTLFVQLLTILGIGWFRQYELTMPLVSTCSAAIGAISQPPVEADGHARFEAQLDEGKLYWGVVGSSAPVPAADEGQHHSEDTRIDGAETSQSDLRMTELRYRHATFSAQEAEPLAVGKQYA